MNKGNLIYLADDDDNIRELVSRFLRSEGFTVEVFPDGIQLYNKFKNNIPDLIIVDIMMPNMDGYSLCAKLRCESDVPIIFISAKDEEQDKLEAFSLGSDDYVTKPFSIRELTARVNSIFKRIEALKNKDKNVNYKIFNIKNLILNTEIRQISIENKVIRLTPLEYDLLAYLIIKFPNTVSRESLLEEVWGFKSVPDTRATDDAIKRLRRKLKEVTDSVQITTNRGYGYMLEVND